MFHIVRLFCRWGSDITMPVQRHPTVCASIMPWSAAICQGESNAPNWYCFILTIIQVKILHGSFTLTVYITASRFQIRFRIFTLHNMQSPISSSRWVRREIMAENKIKTICCQRFYYCVFGSTNSWVFANFTYHFLYLMILVLSF